LARGAGRPRPPALAKTGLPVLGIDERYTLEAGEF
jgi:hypothetical protein